MDVTRFLTCSFWMTRIFLLDTKATDRARSDALTSTPQGSWWLQEIPWNDLSGFGVYWVGTFGTFVFSGVSVAREFQHRGVPRLGISSLAGGLGCTLVSVSSDAPQFLEVLILYDAEGIFYCVRLLVLGDYVSPFSWEMRRQFWKSCARHVSSCFHDERAISRLLIGRHFIFTTATQSCTWRACIMSY